jgi:hypothetical protein
MAYGKKYVKKTTKKTYVKKSPTKGPAMSMQVAKLQRQVNRLTAVAINKIQYQSAFSQNMTNVAGTSAYLAYPLTQFSSWTRIFGTDADDEVNKQALIKSITGRWQMATNEPDNRTYSIWVVSLKDNASELLNNDGTLAALTSGTHYIGDSDRVLLNLKFFNVHYHRARHAGVLPQNKAAVGTAGAIQNISTVGEDSVQLGRFSIKCGKNGMKVLNPSGDWKAGGYPKDPSKNYYFLNFWSGDSSVDLEYPGMYVNTLAQVEVSG